MAKLADQETHEAWEEFKKYLLQIGQLQNPDEDSRFKTQRLMMQNLAQMAFKQGYVAGSSKESIVHSYEPQIEILTPEQSNQLRAAYSVDPELVAATIEQEVSALTRQFKMRNNRTFEQIKQDNETVEELLRENIEPMPLYRIIEIMRTNGHKHWHNGSASGFMKKAIRDGANIEWLGRGKYAYKFGGVE